MERAFPSALKTGYLVSNTCVSSQATWTASIGSPPSYIAISISVSINPAYGRVINDSFAFVIFGTIA
jgi:hypothetical protein